MRPGRWFDWSPRQLAEHCIAHLVRARTLAEDGNAAPAAEEFAYKMLEQQGGDDWLGLCEFRQCLDTARRLFCAPDVERPAAGSPEAQQLTESALALAQSLVDASRRMMNDPDFDRYVWPWVNSLFEPAALVG